MTNSELLTAISEMFEAKLEEKLSEKFDALEIRLASVENRLESVENRLESVENRLESVENRLESVENRLESAENRLESVENRVESLEIKIESVENRVGSLETKSDSTEHSIASISNAIIKIQLFLENQLLPRLQTIESCYLDTYKRYSTMADKIQAAIDDVDILKRVVCRHSELLQMTS